MENNKKRHLIISQILLLLLFNINILFSQNIDKQQVSVIFRFNQADFSIDENKYFLIQNGDSITIETLRFYMSNIEFQDNGKTIVKDKSTAHLIDAEDAQSLHFVIDAPQNTTYNQLKFDLGIDSLTNVSGALGGDLDPTKGMYWTWQSGYINFKIEGKNPRCNTRNHAFQFHLGGYNLLHNALQTIVLDIKKDKEINVIFDISKFINEIDFIEKPNIMSPCREAVLMSKKIAKGFY